MRKTTWLATIGLAAAALALLLLLPVGQAISSEIVQVVITNWPTTQTVKGEMVVTAPVPLATEVSILEIVVPPVPRGETTRLIEAGTVVTDGFPSLVFSLHGEVRGEVQKPGSVGVILAVGATFADGGTEDFDLVGHHVDATLNDEAVHVTVVAARGVGVDRRGNVGCEDIQRAIFPLRVDGPRVVVVGPAVTAVT